MFDIFLKQIVEQFNPVRFSFMARRVLERIICLALCGHLSEFLLRISVNVIELNGPWLFSFPILRDGIRRVNRKIEAPRDTINFSTRFDSVHRLGRDLIFWVNQDWMYLNISKMNIKYKDKTEWMRRLMCALFALAYEGHPISSDNDPIKQNLFL